MDTKLQSSPVVYLYVLGASADPDHVRCCVPWEVDEREIFFGPCKKSLRLHLKRTLLRDGDEVAPSSDHYVVGVNALSSQGVRKVVWAGRIHRLMTFARAHDLLVGERYERMRGFKESPLHVAPLRDEATGRLLGYRRRPNGDHPKDWPRDLITTGRGVLKPEDELLLRQGVTPQQGFGRDVCFTADNLFFARGQGIAIDSEAVSVLRAAQREAEGVDEVAVFGRRKGVPDGLRGRYLRLDQPELVERFLEWLRARAARITRPDAREECRCA